MCRKSYSMSEAQFQSKVIKYLKDKGCYVIKTKPGPGIPTGCPDVLALIGGLWLALELKANSKSKFEALQEITIKKMDDWSYARVVYPENWQEIKAELEEML